MTRAFEYDLLSKCDVSNRKEDSCVLLSHGFNYEDDVICFFFYLSFLIILGQRMKLLIQRSTLRNLANQNV